MKNTVILLTLLLIIFGMSVATAVAQQGIITSESNYSAEETADRLENILKDNGITVFKRIHHHEGAASVNMDLPPAIVIIFGNPKLGTPIMQCAPTAAIDLPQKMLIWQTENGRVKIGYNAPGHLKGRHNIEGCDQELQKIGNALDKFATAAGQ